MYGRHTPDRSMLCNGALTASGWPARAATKPSNFGTRSGIPWSCRVMKAVSTRWLGVLPGVLRMADSWPPPPKVLDVLQETQLTVFRRLRNYLARQPMTLTLWLRKTAQERLLERREKHIECARRDVRREISLSEHSSLLLSQRLVAVQTSPHASRGPEEIRTCSAETPERPVRAAVGRFVVRILRPCLSVLLSASNIFPRAPGVLSGTNSASRFPTIP
jgi:hypothetical protein